MWDHLIICDHLRLIWDHLGLLKAFGSKTCNTSQLKYSSEKKYISLTMCFYGQASPGHVNSIESAPGHGAQDSGTTTGFPTRPTRIPIAGEIERKKESKHASKNARKYESKKERKKVRTHGLAKHATCYFCLQQKTTCWHEKAWKFTALSICADNWPTLFFRAAYQNHSG